MIYLVNNNLIKADNKKEALQNSKCLSCDQFHKVDENTGYRPCKVKCIKTGERLGMATQTE
jgi:hypothetical protein